MFENLRAQFHFAVLHFRQNSNRRLAITLQQPQKFALCSQAKQRVVIVDWIDNLSRAFIIAANLERNDPLPAGGQKNFARKNLHEKFPAVEVDFASRQRKTEPLQPGPGEHDRIPIVLGELAQTRRDVASKINNLQVRILPIDLMFSSHAARRNCCALPKRCETARSFCNQYVIHQTARKNCGDLDPSTQLTRQIFRAMHSKINLVRQQCPLDCRCEQPFAPRAPIQGFSFAITFVPHRSNDVRFDRHVLPLRMQPVRDHARLRPRQFASTRSEHSFL